MSDPVARYLERYGPGEGVDPVEYYLARYGPPKEPIFKRIGGALSPERPAEFRAAEEQAAIERGAPPSGRPADPRDLVVGALAGSGQSVTATARGGGSVIEQLLGLGFEAGDELRERERALAEAVPESAAGAMGAIAGRLGTDVAQIGLTPVLRAPRLLAGPVRSTPLAATQALGGEESSSAAFGADIARRAGKEGTAEFLEEIAQSPIERALFEAGIDVTLGTALEAAPALRRAARAPAQAPTPRPGAPEQRPIRPSEPRPRSPVAVERPVPRETPQPPRSRPEAVEERLAIGEAGFAVPELIGTAAGAGLGAATGGLIGEEEGAVVGGLAGAGVGALAARRLLRRPSDALGAAAPRIPKADPFAGAVDPEDFARLSKFGLDPEGERALAQEVERVVREQNIAPKTRVTHTETVNQARTIAKDLGLNPERVQFKPGRLSGAEAVAIRNVVNRNISELVNLTNDRANPTLSAEALSDIDRSLAAIRAQNDHLLGRFVKERSEAGRTLNSYKIVAQKVDDPFFWHQHARRAADRDLTQKEADTLTRLTGELQRATGMERDRAASALADYMARLRPSSGFEKAAGFFKANLLTLPATHVVNVSSTATNVLFERMSRRPAVFFDWAISKTLRSAREGDTLRTLTMPTRTGVDRIKRAGLKAPEASILDKIDFARRVNYDNRILDAYVNGVFALLGAQDRLFLNGMFRWSLAQEVKTWAKNTGRAYEPALQEIVDSLTDGVQRGAARMAPVDDFVQRATVDATQSTFRDLTRMGRTAESTRRNYPILHFFAPFTRTPSAVATRVLEGTPAGGMWAAMDWVRLWRAATKGRESVSVAGRVMGIDEAQREISKMMGRSVTGSGLMLLGAVLAANGLMIGARKRYGSPEQRAQELAGRQPNAIKLGGEWRDVARFTPPGMLLALGATLYEDVTRGGVLAGAAMQPVRVGQIVLDQPFLTGVQAPIEALSRASEGAVDVEAPAGEVAKIGANVLRGFVPAASFAGGVARGTTEGIRSARGGSTVEQGLGRIGSGIPGVASRVPVVRDPFGEAVHRPGGDVRRLVEAVFSPSRATVDRTDDPVIGELLEVGWAPTRLQRREGESAEAFDGRQELYGKFVRAAIEEVMSDEGYQALARIRRSAARERQQLINEALRDELSSAVGRVRSALTRQLN